MTCSNNCMNPPCRTGLFYALMALGGAVVALTMIAFFHLEHTGHIETGMSNQVVWGLPHVFALFLIVAASGVLNVASIGSVFGKHIYKVRAPLSGMLALTTLAGGLAVLVLDLGRPDRLMVAMTHYNFKSIFALNMIFYNGFFAIVLVYLVTQMDKRWKAYSRPVGLLAFFWRIALTTATGSIFGLLTSRVGYNSALMAPMFVILSFAYGLSMFLIVQAGLYRWNNVTLDPQIQTRLKNLLAVFIGAALYFTAVFHLSNLYWARQWDFERFLLVDGGIYPVLFWGGQIFLGAILPLMLLFTPQARTSMAAVVLAAILVIVGGHAQMFVTLVGGQAFPLVMFPGYAESSSFFDGVVHGYTPSGWELMLAFGGMAVTFLLTSVCLRAFKFMPRDDQHEGGHH